MAKSLAGTRIRERRRMLGMRQGALAKAAGISASYLNLIEHNRRNAAGRVLLALAEALDTPLRSLSEGAEAVLVQELLEAAAGHNAEAPETTSVEELVGRYPGWARLVAAQSRQMRDQDAAIAALTERMNSDPHLQDRLHEMLTSITAIRSTSGILASESDIPQDQTDRFHSAVQHESERLSKVAQELVAYFDRIVERPRDAATPQEAQQMFLERHGYSFPMLEEAADPGAEIDTLLEASGFAHVQEATIRVRAWLTTFTTDARAMPRETFTVAARDAGFRPDLLAQTFGVSIHAVFRRLATLGRKDRDFPKFGLVIINAAGQPLFRRPLDGFSLPRFSSICALWPVFEALTHPAQAMEDIIVLPDGSEYLARALATPLESTRFGAAPTLASGMLVVSMLDARRHGMLGSGTEPRRKPVGSSCRLCPRPDCMARSDPTILPV